MLKQLDPGHNVLTARLIGMRFDQIPKEIKAELPVKIFSNDYDVLKSWLKRRKGFW